MIERIKASDWSFIRAVSWNAAAITIGRLLGFIFSFVGARAFPSDEFGYITYVIALGSIVSIIAQPFAQHVFSYFLGKNRDNELESEAIISNVWSIGIIIFVVTLVVGIPLLSYMGLLSIELMIIYVGFCVFYGYYGIASGFLASNKLSFVYIGSNVVQTILVVICVFVLNIRNTSVVLAIYGLAYFPPVIFIQYISPLTIRFHLRFDLPYVIQIVRIAIPIIFSHMLYVGYNTGGVILLSLFMNDAAIGIYGFTQTMASVFGFVPNGFQWLLMPKIAGMTSGVGSLVVSVLTILTAINLIGTVLFLGLYEWFVITFINASYFIGIEFVLILVIGNIVGGYFRIFTSTFVGIGKPSYQTISQVVILFIAIFSGFVLIPAFGLIGVALMSFISRAVGLVVYIILGMRGFRKPKLNVIRVDG